MKRILSILLFITLACSLRGQTTEPEYLTFTKTVELPGWSQEDILGRVKKWKPETLPGIWHYFTEQGWGYYSDNTWVFDIISHDCTRAFDSYASADICVECQENLYIVKMTHMSAAGVGDICGMNGKPFRDTYRRKSQYKLACQYADALHERFDAFCELLEKECFPLLKEEN